MTPVAGALVTPNVRLLRVIGKGGMGSVWVAEHLTLRTHVAVKFISEDYAQDAEALERFSREAAAAAQIKSPHVVQVLDHGVYVSSPYIVMELLEGEDLAARIERGPLTLGETAVIVSQIAKALTQAHGVGIVHRDIKPANAYLTQSGGELLVKVLDFGVAKFTSPGKDPAYRMTQTGQIVGTPGYMSPEQVFSRGPADTRIDLWALGVVAYEALTTELPFMGTTLGDLYLAINEARFRPPTSLERAFPSGLDGWFKRAFARDPAARFPSAREMADALAAVAAKAPDARRKGAAHEARLPSRTEALAVSTTDSDADATRPGARPRGRGAVVLGAAAGAMLVGGIFAALVVRPRLASDARQAAEPGGATASAVTSAEAPPASASAPVVAPAPEASASASASASAAAPPSGAASAQRPRAPDGRPTAPPPSTTNKPRRRDHGF